MANIFLYVRSVWVYFFPFQSILVDFCPFQSKWLIWVTISQFWSIPIDTIDIKNFLQCAKFYNQNESKTNLVRCVLWFSWRSGCISDEATAAELELLINQSELSSRLNSYVTLKIALFLLYFLTDFWVTRFALFLCVPS